VNTEPHYVEVDNISARRLMVLLGDRAETFSLHHRPNAGGLSFSMWWDGEKTPHIVTLTSDGKWELRTEIRVPFK
jgi:hypothetical protein